MDRPSTHRRGERVTAALALFSNFLSHPSCQQCEVLEICLQRLYEDAVGHRATVSKDALQQLRQTVPFPVSHAPAGCGRCLPAEMLMVYLTPGGKLDVENKEDHLSETPAL